MIDEVEGKEDEEVPCVEGVLEGALGALGDEHFGEGDGVLLSSFVKSMKSWFGGMTTSFCFLEVLEFELLGGDMMIW